VSTGSLFGQIARMLIPHRDGRRHRMFDFDPETEGPRPGEAVMFWGWLSLIGVGLALMILLPLTGK